jgi:hypothetical protein
MFMRSGPLPPLEGRATRPTLTRMKNTPLMLIAGLALMACTPPEPVATTASTETPAAPAAADPAPPAATPTDPAADTCNMAQYAALVGMPATDPGVPPASSTVRHITPNTQVTMDFLPTRLNIDINADGVITGLRCG